MTFPRARLQRQAKGKISPAGDRSSGRHRSPRRAGEPRQRHQNPSRGTEPALGAALDFMRLLWALDHRLSATSKRMQALLGVTGPQRLVLRLLGRFPGVSAGQLAKMMHVHPSTLTGVLARLVRRRLVRRWPDPLDGRRTLLGLGTAGEQINRERRGTVESSVRAALSSLPRDSVHAAETVLLALIHSLEVQSPLLDGKAK